MTDLAAKAALETPADAIAVQPADGIARLTFIGTATTLLRLGPFTLLTDPNFVRRGTAVPLGYGMQSRRLTDPAMPIDQLPALDAVVLSHLHGDHFDELAETRLPPDLPIVTTRQAAVGLGRKGFRDARGLRTWSAETFRRGDATLRITAVPGRHAPGVLRALLPHVMGSVIDLSIGRERVLRLYITGDTLIHDRLHRIPQRFPDIDAAIVHLGGTRLAGLLLTMDADQGVELLRIVEPRVAVPVHFDDYPVFTSPLSAFLGAVARDGRQRQVREVRRGETIDLREAVAVATR